ncbi:InlB B-repeat-containing protein [Faecalibacterium prausnitzii]|uniref:InlB B-repeat-containing protein n=1 Tax=Faecalibacterium prausnitzii TaxID=853 RepID=UPI0029666FED|nr:InlB B-repeat-containing protein [Faecalibacterium prausnitzii]MDW2997170.1 InlB B-repeat-containing protein [Faecalibacterium prausnitzii]
MINFSQLSAVPINCYVELSNATVTGGIIRQADFKDVTIEGGTFDYLSCMGKCTISKAVAQNFSFDRFGDLAISDTVLCKLSGNGIENALADGQQLSTLTVRNGGGVTAINGRDLPLSVNTIYLVGNASAELTLNTDVFSINGAAANSYNEQTYAEGTVLHITGNNDGKEILVNQAGDPSNLKPLRITEEGLPDRTGVTPHSVSEGGVTGDVYEGLGWQYAEVSGEDEDGYRTMSVLILTSPDGSPVNLTSDTINPHHATIASDQIVLTDVTVAGIQAGAPVIAQNAIIEGGTFQKAVNADGNSSIAGGTFQESVEANGTIANGIFQKSVQAYGEITDGQFEAEVRLGYNGTITGGTFQKSVQAYGEITGGQFNATVQLNSSNAQILGGVFNNIKLPDYYNTSEGTVIQNAVITGSLMANTYSKAAVSNTVSCGYIESKYLAAGQQQSKLMMTDGTVERLNDYAAATDAVYLIGNVKAEIRFSNTVTNINGAEASNYNEGTSAIDRSLTITAKNDGEPIVVNMAATGKLPFSSLSKSDFDIDWSTLVPGITCKKDGVGKLSLVYVRTSDNKVFATYPPYDEYGVYKQRIVAQEGDKYTEGSLDIGEVVRKYTPSSADFAYDSKTQTATYNGKMYFDDAPLYSIQYGAEDGSFPSVTKPTKAGTYSVYIVVNDSDHYVGNQYEVGTYTVSESKYTLTVDDKSTEHVAGEKLSFTADEKDGYTFTGWKVTGLPTDVDTTKATISFTMPANNVTLKAQYTENAPETYELKVTDAKVTLKDGSAVADLKAVPVGTELVATAAEKDGYTFTGWEVTGLPADVDTTKATISFTMPANKVTLKAQYTENAPETYELKVTDAKVTLKDGGTVADLKAVPVGTELVATAPEKDGYTFTGWEVTGLPTDVDTTKATITFKMPANNVTLKAQYTENAPETYELKVTDAKVTLKDGGTVADLKAVPVGTELKATADEDTETRVFKCWTGLELAEEQSTARVVYFTMPDHDVNLKAEFVTPTNKLEVTDAQVTLKDGGAVADLTAVPVGTELVATAAEKDGYTFTGWEVTGLPADVDTTKATISFTMPANKVTLKAQYTENAPKTYKLDVSDATVTLKDGSAVADLKAVPVGTELVATAAEKDGYTFTGWEVTGLPTDVDTTKATISFTMPANKVTLKAQYTENAPKTYKLDVSDATVTLKDGGAVADLTAVPVDTELKVIADEDTETSVFKNWSCTGLELTEEQSTAHVLEFKMPAQDVKLTAVFEVPATPDPDPTPDPKPDPDPDPEPTPDPKPDPNPDPDPTPDPKPDPNPDPDPTPDPKPDPTPDPEPTPDPKPNPNPDPTPAPGGDSDGGGAIVMVAAVGSAAIGAGAYIVGTTAYLKSVLPEGMAIPANRQQLAVALWTAAGKPATQSTALFNDVAADAAELQAIRWVVETGLMTAQDGNFKPGSRVGRLEVIRTWKNYQQRG